MQIIRVAASNDNIDLAPFSKVVGAFLSAPTADSSALVFDSLVQAGATDVFSLYAFAKTNSPCMHFPAGQLFKTAISVTLAGSGAVLYLFVE
jgi:hypothetical protein